MDRPRCAERENAGGDEKRYSEPTSRHYDEDIRTVLDFGAAQIRRPVRPRGGPSLRHGLNDALDVDPRCRSPKESGRDVDASVGADGDRYRTEGVT